MIGLELQTEKVCNMWSWKCQKQKNSRPPADLWCFAHTTQQFAILWKYEPLVAKSKLFINIRK